MGGNLKLYVDLLRQFVSGQADAAARVGERLAAGDRAVAERIAHTVKGVAGNIGANIVHRSAADLEKSIREGQPPERLEVLRLALARDVDTLTQQIAPYIQNHAPIQEAEEPAGVDEKALQAAVSLMESLLEQSDPGASELFSANRAGFRSMFLPQDLASFEHQVDSYSFEEALATLRSALAKRRDSQTPP